MSIRLFVLSLFLLMQSINHFAIGQNMIIYDETQTLKLEFTFEPSQGENSMPNYFISNMAVAQSKIRSYYKYAFSAKVKRQLIKKARNQYQVKIEIDSLSWLGDFDYKGFDFSRLIIPLSIELEYQVKEVNQGINQNKRIEINGLSSINFDSTFVDSTAIGSFQLGGELLKSSFAESQFDAFRQAILNIDTYYSEGMVMQEIKQEIMKLNDEDLDKFQLYQIDLKYIRKKYNKLTIGNFASQMSLSTTDPAGNYALYLSLGNEIESQTQVFERKAASLDTLLYQKAMEYLAEGIAAQAEIYFNKSLQINNKFIPSWYQLALADFQNGQFLQSEEKLNQILKINRNHNQCNALANKTYEGMLLSGMALNKEENFNAGLEILEQAKAFCEDNKDIIRCDYRQDKAIAQAQYGMYTSFLSIAGAAMQRGRLDMTEDYLNTAYELQQHYPQSIDNTAEANTLMNLLVTQYLRMSLELKANYQSTRAKSYLAYADSLALAHQLTDAQSFVAETQRKFEEKQVNTANTNASGNTIQYSTIASVPPEKAKVENLSKTTQEQYEYHIEKGDVYLNYWRYDYAYAEYKAARKMELDNHLDYHKELMTKLQKSGKESIASTLENGNLQAWSGKYLAARNLLANALQEIDFCELQQDSSLKIAVEELRTNLQKEDLTKLSYQFNDLMNKARQSIDLKDFVSVKRYCNEALQIKRDNPTINVDTDYPLNLLEKYDNAINYQLALLEANSQCKNGQYNLSIVSLLNANELYDAKQLELLQLPKQSLLATLIQCHSNEISQAAITYCIQNKETELIKQLIIESEKSNIKMADETKIQSLTYLAHEDFIAHKFESKQSAFISQYGAYPSLKKFKKYYYKNFK